MIYAEHAWKTNPKGEPLAKYFNENQWNATGEIRRFEDGKQILYNHAGWIATEAPQLVEPEPAPEPLKATPAKKVARKRKTKK
jgi:hypothetical protein